MEINSAERLKAAAHHIAANLHEFEETEAVDLNTFDPAAYPDAAGTFYQLAEGQEFTLPMQPNHEAMNDEDASDDDFYDDPVTLKGPGIIEIAVIGDPDDEPWFRVYFVQGVNEDGDTVAYELSAT